MLQEMMTGSYRQHYIALFTAAGTVALFAGALAAWIGAHWGARRLAREAAHQIAEQQRVALEVRLAALEHLAEEVHVAVERVAEGQRLRDRSLRGGDVR